MPLQATMSIHLIEIFLTVAFPDGKIVDTVRYCIQKATSYALVDRKLTFSIPPPPQHIRIDTHVNECRILLITDLETIFSLLIARFPQANIAFDPVSQAVVETFHVNTIGYK